MLQLYFFTVEFGLCKQNGELRVYGAGLLSSVAELKHAIASKEKIKRFDPDVTCKQECIITSFQNAYWYTDSFEEAKEKMRYDDCFIKLQSFTLEMNVWLEILGQFKK